MILAATAHAALASMTTYDFTQTGDWQGRSSVTGIITMENGTFVNQAAADALNSAQYSINLSSDITSEVWTFTSDNSQWSILSRPDTNGTITLKSNGLFLEITVAVIAESFPARPYIGLDLTNGFEPFPSDGNASFRYEVPMPICQCSPGPPHCTCRINFLRYGSAIIDGIPQYNLFQAIDWEWKAFPFTAQFTYRYPVLASTPSEQVEAVVNYIETAIAAGDLVGVGSGNSADKKVQALINMIGAAGDLLEAGQTIEGCQQLAAIYLKVDGTTPPPDFVTGNAREDLASAIQGLRNRYKCQ